MSLKILVVEDDTATLELMSEILTRFEVEVHALDDSQEALSLINQFRFDGIFLDLMMPILDGYRLARAIRQSLCNGSTPIVFITGSDEKSVMQHTFTAGGSFYLQKPIDRQKIRMLLNSTKGLMLDSRRGIRRVAVRINVSCSCGGSARATVSHDLSERGIRIEGQGSFRSGNEIALSFVLPGQTKPIHVSGQVVRIDERGHAGVHFMGIGQTDRQRIRLFIDSQSQRVAGGLISVENSKSGT